MDLSRYFRRRSQSGESLGNSSQVRRPGSSYTLKAVIDDPSEVYSPRNGYSVTTIQEKRNRSLTLEAMARKPLYLEGTETLPSPPIPPRSRSRENVSSTTPKANHSIVSESHSPRAFSPGGSRLGPTSRPSQPLRQYQHQQHSDSPTSNDEDFHSAKSSFTNSTDSLSVGNNVIASPTDFHSPLSSPAGHGRRSQYPHLEHKDLVGNLPHEGVGEEEVIRSDTLNSILSTLSSGSNNNFTIPPRYSSLKQKLNHKPERDYFGLDASPSPTTTTMPKDIYPTSFSAEEMEELEEGEKTPTGYKAMTLGQAHAYQHITSAQQSYIR